MTLYQMSSEWEHNGPDDSDWYVVVYDSEKNKLHRVCTGTTRFANALPQKNPYPLPTPEITEKAKQILTDMAFEKFSNHENGRVSRPHPESLTEGMELRVTENFKCMIKENEVSPCNKCNGTKQWINPRNSMDKRMCFACKGTGEVKSNFTRKKNSEGKQEWHKVSIGTIGKVIRWDTFGTFYANGYNKPGRNNTTVILQLEDGREVKCILEKLRLNEEPKCMREAATAYGEREDYYSFWATAAHGCRFV